jgi:hypothetical protein
MDRRKESPNEVPVLCITCSDRSARLGGRQNVVLQTGKTVNCKVCRFKDGIFTCVMADGTTNQFSSTAIGEIVFGVASDEQVFVLSDEEGLP